MSTRNCTACGHVEVDLAALGRNYDKLRRESAGAEVAAVVKANAYGLGMVPIARHLAGRGCRSYFVATLEEGRTLRQALPDPAIYVFEGPARGCEAVFVEHGLAPVLNTPDQVRRWLGTGRPGALHVDTGMSRLGMSIAEAETLADASRSAMQRSIDLVVTHLACADVPEHPLNANQVERFAAVAERFDWARMSIGSSAGTFLGPQHRGALVRAGIALYGGNPFENRDSPVEVVASLRARILQLRELEADSPVGYGATYTAKRGDRLATIGVGYADGYPRRLGGRGAASIAGHRAPIVGRISMDLTVLDVSSVPREAVELGQHVELFGRDIRVEEVAALCGTISYEILSGLGERLERVYVE